MPPKILALRIVSAAPISLPLAISRIKSGISIEVGHAVWQGASWEN
jgi:hypothetical protein